MTLPIRILLQTTIPPIVDDWSIRRFSMLCDFLAGLTDRDGAPLFAVTARDRAAVGAPDPILSAIDRSDFDELWLFAVDTGDGLHSEDCAAIGRFRQSGRGLLVTRDHMAASNSSSSLVLRSVGLNGLISLTRSRQPLRLQHSRKRAGRAGYTTVRAVRRRCKPTRATGLLLERCSPSGTRHLGDVPEQPCKWPKRTSMSD